MINPQFNYPLPKVAITASQVGTIIPVSIGGSFQQSVWIEANNETPYILSCYSAQGILLTSIQPQFVDIFQIPSGDTFFNLIPSLLLPQAAPSSEVDINVYPFGQPSGTYPSPLNRQSAPTSGATNIAFNYHVSFLTTIGTFGNVLIGGIFNPNNNSKIAILHTAHISVSTSVATFPEIEFGFNPGPRDAGGGGGTITPTDTVSITTMQSFFSSNTPLPAGTKLWRDLIISTQANVQYDLELLPFPNQRQIPMNTNVWIALTNVATTTNLIGEISFEFEER